MLKCCCCNIMYPVPWCGCIVCSLNIFYLFPNYPIPKHILHLIVLTTSTLFIHYSGDLCIFQ